MAQSERYAWASLAALAAIYWYFQMRLLDGLVVVDQSAERLLFVYFVTLALSTLAAIGLSAIIFRGRRSRDERDVAIEARAGQHERWFVIAAINVMIWHALWDSAFSGRAPAHVDLANLPTLFFWLFTILFAGEAVKLVTTIALYRAQAGRG